MISDNDRSPTSRWIPVAAAADLIGQRFHSDWTEADLAMLEFNFDLAPDREAWDRAKHVQDLLHGYITGGHVTAYALKDDGSGITELPRPWVTDPVFAICLRTGTFRFDLDIWDSFWIDGPELSEALPKVGKPRQKHTFEWDKIVHEAWKFTLSREGLPTNATVVRHLGEWCPANKQSVPDGSLLSKTAKTILDFLKRTNRDGNI